MRFQLFFFSSIVLSCVTEASSLLGSKIQGEFCWRDKECKSGYCSYAFSCSEQADENEFCLENDDCKTGNCHMTQCKSADGKFENGVVCYKNTDCISDFCGWDRQCSDKYENGSGCGFDSDCKSNNCYWYTCRAESYPPSVDASFLLRGK